jgi:hypothetical protein
MTHRDVDRLSLKSSAVCQRSLGDLDTPYNRTQTATTDSVETQNSSAFTRADETHDGRA